uniref:Uncharacterized protein n=1 Tax=Ralstonia solanacearum TaxID=305 RepID=A0A0S4VVA3_RALSL|nr:conserved protein of unknown function [Ralstonia solanacearum]CUV35044.1 conserved protein of unknown function [Ralstonia solanacearum]CUV38486.1 conserved protein of unknown function [Ralstonia solanacearum]CUV59123.1 conserved protein of unknown function [Ralstonia solanacearum]
MLPSKKKFGEFIVVAIKVCGRDPEYLCKLLCYCKRRFMNAAFVAANACARSGLVQADVNAEDVLGNADPPPCVSQATSEYSNRLFLSHSANIVDSALRFSTEFVEFGWRYKLLRLLGKASSRGQLEA